ncbi:MAG TPA: hypothetical protein DDY32_06475 [Desulfobulbaceae bacterium]|nr:hypothetical protein [Desulfobulbaceae bacterium]
MKTLAQVPPLHGLPLALLGIFLLLSACGRTPPAAYYHLSAVDPGRQGSPMEAIGEAIGEAAIGEAAIGIGPVRLPDYLDRPQIVNLEGSNRLQLAEGHRWAEPLKVSIPRTIRENLATALATEKLFYFPWNQAVDYQIPVEIVRFEGVGYQMAHLEAIWSVQDPQGTAILAQRRSEYRVPTGSSDSEGLVQALSQALGLFSREIAEQLKVRRE